MTLNLAGDCWPTLAQRSFLRAALLPDERAVEAWRGYQQTAGEPGDDPALARLFPVLYRNLRALGVSDPGLPEYKASYRRTWYRNQALFAEAANMLRRLHAMGLPTVVLKGMALSVLYYHDMGLRPTSDYDILVPANAAEAVFNLVAQLGWRPAAISADPRAQLGLRHSIAFAADHNFEFDLHLHVLVDRYADDDDQAFWDDAVPLEINHVLTWALCPADQLLHICVHGARWSNRPAPQWVADATYILRNTGQALDWQRLVRRAAQLRLSRLLEPALRFLRAVLEAPVPLEVLAALQAIPVSEADRRYAGLVMRRPGLLGELPLSWHRFQTLTSQGGQRITPWGFGQYLRRAWGLPSVSKMPPYMINKIFRRVKAVMHRQEPA